MVSGRGSRLAYTTHELPSQREEVASGKKKNNPFLSGQFPPEQRNIPE